MKVTADKNTLFDLLTWHGKGSSSGLVRVSIAEDGAPLVIESASADSGWQSSTLEVKDSAAGQAAFSVMRVMAQKRLGKNLKEMTLETQGTTVTSHVGRSKASSPALLDIPEFWRPEPTEGGGDPFTVVAEVDSASLAWLLRAGDALRSGDITHPTHATALVIEDSTVKVHATDGYKMGFGEIESLIPGTPSKHYISPSALSAPLAIMKDAETIELIEVNGHLGLRGAGSIMVRPSLAAGPPAMEGLLDQAHSALEASTPLVLPVSDFSDALAGIGLGKNGSTLVEVREDYIVVSNANTSSDMEGETKVEVEAQVPEGANGSTFKFNAANASSVLSQFRTADVAMTRNKRMVILSEPGDGSGDKTPFVANISLVK